ncbi:hypothetical protein [Pseudonocardia sp. HH130629-09]|nr:hypothetical protein [Pseudonocardia sp. HH130629-09]
MLRVAEVLAGRLALGIELVGDFAQGHNFAVHFRPRDCGSC